MGGTMKKKNIFWSIFLVCLAVLFTILVQIVDVRAIGPNDSYVGFATLNQAIFTILKTSEFFYFSILN